jgi:CheY-like chemotaxis protein
MELFSATQPARLAQGVVSSLAAKLRVHLVDDNQEAVDSLAHWVSLFDYETLVSYTGTDALEAAQSFLPDVMLIDIMLPGLDGYELAASLRGRPTFEGTTFIAVTGLGDQEYVRAAGEGLIKQAKFNLHFAKPVDLDLLQSVLASLAKKKRASQGLSA